MKDNKKFGALVIGDKIYYTSSWMLTKQVFVQIMTIVKIDELNTIAYGCPRFTRRLYFHDGSSLSLEEYELEETSILTNMYHSDVSSFLNHIKGQMRNFMIRLGTTRTFEERLYSKVQIMRLYTKIREHININKNLMYMIKLFK